MSFTSWKARSDGLVIEEMGAELVVYDRSTDTVHHLNQSAAAVWRHCDGSKDLDALRIATAAEIGPEFDENALREALSLLDEAALLEATGAPVSKGLSRRDLLIRIGLTAAAIPVVTSILAPTAAAAATCVGQTCDRTLNQCPGENSTTVGSCRCNAATGNGSCITCLASGATPSGGDFHLCCSLAQQGSSGKCN